MRSDCGKNHKKKYNLSKEFLNHKYTIEHQNTYKIAKEVGCNPELIRLYLIKLNIPRRSKNSCKVGIKQSKEHVKRRMLGRKGYKHSKETLLKIAKHLAKKEKSNLEIKIENICRKYRLPFKFCGDGSFPVAYKYPDFVCKRKKLLIEVFSRYFKIKVYGSVLKYIRQRRKIFENKGYKTLFITDNELHELLESKIAEKISLFYIGGRKQ